MIQRKIQGAISILKCIYDSDNASYTEPSELLSPSEISDILNDFRLSHFIELSDINKPEKIESYRRISEPNDISLLDIYLSTGEKFDSSRPPVESFYIRYGYVACKLGVVSQLTRKFLQEIKLMEVW